MERKEINILDYFYLFYKGWKFIVANFFIVVVFAAIASFFMPVYYKSSALLLPPKEEKKGFGFSDVLSSIPITSLQLGQRGTPVDLQIGVLKCETMAISIIDKFNLIEVYGVENRDQARKVLKSLSDIKITKEGMIEIEVQDRDPKRAADIANIHITMLDSLRQAINQRKAKARGDFIEQQMNENAQAIKLAEIELKEFQLKTKAISPFYQQHVAISVAAELELELIKQERQLREYRSTLSDSHPFVIDLLTKIKISEDLLQVMRFGKLKKERESLFVPLQETPGLTLQYAKLERRLEILGMLEQLLTQHYEEARIEQVNPTSTITIVDRARPAIQKFRPKRKVIVLVAGAASLFFTIIAILVIEFFNRLTELSDENRRKVEQLSRFLRIK